MRARDSQSSAALASLHRLRRAFRAWLEVIGEKDVWEWRPTTLKCHAIHARLSQFKTSRDDSVEELVSTVSELSRGKYLVEAAIMWQKPLVGAESSRTAMVRGDQWRLVMAWGGLEVMIKALIPTTGIGVSPLALRDFVGGCRLEEYEPLEAPRRGLKGLQRWLQAESRFGQEAILAHLGQRNSKKSPDAVRDWLILGNPVISWVGALHLAQLLRHKTAHGALSATKVVDWGMRPAFIRLVLEIAVAASAAFERLAEEP